MTTLNHPRFAGVIESKQRTRCLGRFTQGESRQFEEGLDGHARLAPGFASFRFLFFFSFLFFESSMSNRVDVCMGCKELFINSASSQRPLISGNLQGSLLPSSP